MMWAGSALNFRFLCLRLRVDAWIQAPPFAIAFCKYQGLPRDIARLARAVMQVFPARLLRFAGRPRWKRANGDGPHFLVQARTYLRLVPGAHIDDLAKIFIEACKDPTMSVVHRGSAPPLL